MRGIWAQVDVSLSCLCALLCVHRCRSLRDILKNIYAVHVVIQPLAICVTAIEEPALAHIEVQSDPGLPQEPDVPRGVYRDRLDRLCDRMKEKQLDALVIYGDREHFGNFRFCTGYDPRFEEAFLVVLTGARPVLLIGVEGAGHSKHSLKLDCEVVIWHPLSLMGISRQGMKALGDILRSVGIHAGMRVGTVGWKYFTEAEFKDPDMKIEIPSFMVDELRHIVGNSDVVNSTDIFMHPDYGLRSSCDIHEVAVSEFGGTLGSRCMNRMIEGLEPGISEYDAVELMRLPGYPMSCHPAVLSGERTGYIPASPSSRRIRLGDPLAFGVAFWGSDVARFAYVAYGNEDLPTHDADYVHYTCVPYFMLLRKWYESVRLGAVCGEIFERTVSELANCPFDLFLNPGHLTDLEEWTNSPFVARSPVSIKSGMIIQEELIPAMRDRRRFGAYVEDGFAIGDESTVQDLRTHYPSVFRRIEARREFMIEQLGINIGSEVLPLCDNQGLLRPFLLNSRLGLRIRCS